MTGAVDRVHGAANATTMRVAVMLSGLPSTGGEIVVVRSLRNLRELGVEPVLVTLNTRRDGPLADEVRAEGIRRIDVRARRMTDPSAIKRLVRAVRRERFDLLHAHDQDSIIIGGMLRMLTGTPLVVHRHVLAEPATALRQAARARAVLATLRHVADRVVVVSGAVEQTLCAAGVPNRRMTTVHNGLSLGAEHEARSREEVRQRLGWASDTPIIMVAWLRPGKGHELLGDIMRRVHRQVPDARLALVGDGELAPDLRVQLSPLGSHAEFLGARDDVPDLLRAADVMLLPSWSEALPTVILEAGAAGLPIVASDVGGTGEIVLDGLTGHLVAPGDIAGFAGRLVQLLQDREQARAIARRAERRVRSHFSVARQAEQTAVVYRDVLAGRS